MYYIEETDTEVIKYEVEIDKDNLLKLKEKIIDAKTVEELIMNTKTKRYTYNKITRMLVHILIGLPKEINKLASIEYIKILGFNKKGREYIT